MAKMFITIGVIFIIFGVLIYLFKDFPLFKLPGDIYIKKEGFSFYFPITTSIILSVIFSIVITILSKFMK